MPRVTRLAGAPGASLEWRLVQAAGTVVDVKRLGDRWRAEIQVESTRISILGAPGSRIPSTALVEGRRATVVGIVRRPYPGASDHRFAVQPRSAADIALGPASGGGAGTGGDTTGDTAPGSGDSSSTGGREGGPDGDGAAPIDIRLADLAGSIGRTVRVSGLVDALAEAGFTLDDGSATSPITLTGDAATYLGLIEPGDAIEVVGRVETVAGTSRAGSGAPSVIVERAADVTRLGDPGDGATPSEDPSIDLGTGVGSSAGPLTEPTAVTDEPAARTAGLGGLPDPSVVGIGWIAVMIGLSVAVTFVRRRRLQRRLAARIAARLADLTHPGGAR
jgi:hypothetical protein